MKYIALILSLLFSVAGFGQGQMYLRATAAGGGPANLLLDDYPGAAAAYAVMKLDNDYAGSCIRIRRDSDSAEQDIGFSGNDIDEASINSFCSGANCFVKIWYDQSGNGNNATQTTTANQPKIYDSSTGIVYQNSIPALSFDGLNDNIQSSSALAYASVSIFSVVNTSDTKYMQYASAFSAYSWVAENGVGGATTANFGTPTMYANGAIAITTSRTDVYNALNGYILCSTVNASTSAWTNFIIAKWSGAGYELLGSMQIFVLYPSDQSANRTAIETIINNYFSIY